MTAAGFAAFLTTVLIAGLVALGRPWPHPTHLIGAAEGPSGSQALIDSYTLVHVAAGLLLQAALRRRTRGWPAGWLLLVAIASSVVWELAENTPALIARFGDGYSGDSLLNAVGDTLALTLGFVAALRLSLAKVFGTAAFVELGSALAGAGGLVSSFLRLMSG